ncbi:MAG: GNAT family N-acetyltransferase [Solirubrobacterales bacterium]|nr:GNAT family N-acetyltransferase [Solirubrobacterales bacterium]
MAAAGAPPSERVLRDGSVISLREVRPSDKAAIAGTFEGLGPESRYRRFFTAMSRLSEADLKYLTDVDHSDHEAVLAFDAEARPVGVARYVRIDNPAHAEVAVAVVDDWQGRGAGTALLERLVERAAEHGIAYFIASVLQENPEAIELFRSISQSDPSPRRSAPGQLELVIELPRGGVQGTLLGRALRSAASGAVEIHPWRLIKERLGSIGSARTDRESRPNR